jgi:hypothetical protein
MATVALQRPSLTGLAAAYAAASAGGDKFDPGEHVTLHVKNASAAAITATVETPNTVLGLAIADVAVSVPAGGDRFIGPFPRGHFAGAGGLVSVTWSATASVTFAPIAV